MSNPKAQFAQKSSPSKQLKPSRNSGASILLEEEIRTRAYLIYESRGRTGNDADEDWSQAETELMELVGEK